MILAQEGWVAGGCGHGGGIALVTTAINVAIPATRDLADAHGGGGIDHDKWIRVCMRLCGRYPAVG